jgi:hypothetical protein
MNGRGLGRKRDRFGESLPGIRTSMDRQHKAGRLPCACRWAGMAGTVFAYGQTSAGKTFTMEGPGDSDDTAGIIKNSFQHIFNQISRTPDKVPATSAPGLGPPRPHLQATSALADKT